MIFQKEYTYTQKAADEALDILRRTELKRNRIVSAVCAALLAAAVVALGVSGSNIRMYILAAVIVLLEGYVLWNRGDEKSAAFSLSPENGQKYWSAQRTLTLYEDRVSVHAPYSDPDEVISAGNRADEEYMSLHAEMIEEMSTLDYPLTKYGCVESESALLLCRPWRNERLPLLKEWFSEDELNRLTAHLQAVMGKRYRRL